ncbi:hypothetical protein ASF48_10570 [Rathayibacter sp. Leaf299]|uniref:N-methyl-L-tryptophan oxidase n=1 Tax=Rathayibacter sp. Leaf299 TaxID=1736328 RepID=UPI0006F35A24|nr:N-methyl-L-tryptophan oxidase [Rathayibacter sp. Leaf299]KQQ20988.1 hypothetical protein ASF48_10570 [Rathayibacter sp. Leaf299]
MGRNQHQTIVIGAGAIGTATAYWLAEKGETDVLVLEQFTLGHTFGASEDHSRIIRHSYHNTAYGDLTQPAYDNWARLEEASGQRLVVKTGGLDLGVEGTAGMEEIRNFRSTLEATGHEYEYWNAAEIRAHYPQWNIDDSVVAVYQEDGGILDIRHANATHVALARGRGVHFEENTRVLEILPNADGVVVRTSNGEITADKIVICTASWTEELLPTLGLDFPWTLTQEQVTYFGTPNLKDFSVDAFPIWIWHDYPLFYGFPVYGEVGTKAARDNSERYITQATRSHEPLAEETALIRAFLEQHLPGSVGPEILSKTCVYDMTPDRNFILDRVPSHPRVSLGIGAGHAAKFAGLIGEIMADVSMTGTSAHDIDFFRASRPALVDPSYQTNLRLVS